MAMQSEHALDCGTATGNTGSRRVVDGEKMSPRCGKEETMTAAQLIDYPVTSQQPVSILGWAIAITGGAFMWLALAAWLF